MILHPEKLGDTNITNHFSTLQYPRAVQDYLDKEIKFRVLLGPVDYTHDHSYHYSPLLTDKIPVICNLSYCCGQSLNNIVSKKTFDGSAFVLKFINDIIEDNGSHDPGEIKFYCKIVNMYWGSGNLM